MQTIVTEIFEEYNKAKRYKEALGEKGLYEQGKINERFYSGNQWYGANCGNDRPLVRHNIIKRIGDFKISQTLADQYKVRFFAQGVPSDTADTKTYDELKAKIKKDKSFTFSGEVTDGEITAATSALSDYYELTSRRVDLESLSLKVLRSAYISGSGVLYTYFDGEADAGIDLSGEKVRGNIKCEALKIDDVYFADNSETDIQAQPYIIISALKSKQAMLNKATQYGTAETLNSAKEDDDGKILVLTKLYKERTNGGVAVKCIMVTEGGILRPAFDTRLHLYPLSLFRFSGSESSAYGESEITYLIPNQIAINRMITASVWSNISAGMPMMLINGDTVSGEISNDPGQIIKIYGTNEDVASAVKFVCPPDFSQGLNNAANTLIENTLTQSGANPSSLGDERAQNASAIDKLQSAALMPMNILKGRYREFIRQNALIWADFWFNLYSNRRIRIEDESGAWYFPLNASRYAEFSIAATVNASDAQSFTDREKAALLGELFDKGIINKKQYLARLPKALIESKYELLSDLKEDDDETK